jgi:hypothetical protein
MWSLVVDELLGELNGSGYYTVGYADYTVILINGKCPSTVSEELQIALGLIQWWCDRTDLWINPTKKKALKGLKEPTHFHKTIQLSTEVKYFGLQLEKGLTWAAQLDRAYRAPRICTQGRFKTFWGPCKTRFGAPVYMR